MKAMLVIVVLSIALLGSIHAQGWTASSPDIYFNGGDVGIGTSSPGYDLHMLGHFRIEHPTDTSRYTDFAHDGPNKYCLQLTGNTAFHMVFDGQATPGFTVRDNDRVGINTVNPDNELTVDGDADFTGNVGIGTDDPGTLLHVSGASNTAPFKVERTSNGKLVLNFVTPTATWELGNLNTTDAFVIQETGNSPFTIESGASQNAFYIDEDSEVGFGTTSPESDVHVAAVNGGIITLSDDVGDGNKILGQISARSDSSSRHPNSTASIRFVTDATFGGQVVETPPYTYDHSTRIAFYTANSDQSESERMRIESDGGVGIGTTNIGSNKLAVGGVIKAEEITVRTGWADFVFEDDYELMPLEELEEHITSRKHLPDIPTADEVDVNGVSLGQMQSKLLQKIEELTLYVIEQNKALEAHEFTLETQRTAIKSQSIAIKELQTENLNLKSLIDAESK